MSQAPTPKQQKAIDALLQGQTREAAAKTAGVDRRTVTRWLNDPNFQEALAQSRFAVGQETLNSLIELSQEAIAVLRQCLQGSEVSTGRARIALDVTRLAIDRVEAAQFQKRLDDLEQKLNEAN